MAKVHPDLAAASKRIAELEAMLVAATTPKPRTVGVKFGNKPGVIQLTGLRQFPVALYREEWRKLIAAIPQVEQFIKDNHAELERVQKEYNSRKTGKAATGA